MRVGWKYIEVLDGILTLFGTLAILPGCPNFILFAYGPRDLSSSTSRGGQIGDFAVRGWKGRVAKIGDPD